MEKWAKEIEEILRKQFEGEELEKQLKCAMDLIDIAQQVEVPSGNEGSVLAAILKQASEDLYSLAAVYAGFQMGVAWERYQNGKRSSGES